VVLKSTNLALLVRGSVRISVRIFTGDTTALGESGSEVFDYFGGWEWGRVVFIQGRDIVGGTLLQRIATSISSTNSHRRPLPTTASHCRPLPVTADHCQSLPTTASHCRPLPVTADHCQSLPTTASHCRPLPVTADHCQSLPTTASHCRPLPVTADHCQSLPTTASHCQPLPASTNYHRLLQTTVDCCHLLFALVAYLNVHHQEDGGSWQAWIISPRLYFQIMKTLRLIKLLWANPDRRSSHPAILNVALIPWSETRNMV